MNYIKRIGDWLERTQFTSVVSESAIQYEIQIKTNVGADTIRIITKQNTREYMKRDEEILHRVTLIAGTPGVPNKLTNITLEELRQAGAFGSFDQAAYRAIRTHEGDEEIRRQESIKRFAERL